MKRMYGSALVAAALFVAGCSDNDAATNDPTTATAAPTTVTAAPTTVAPTTPPTSAAAPTTVSCEQIGFTPNSDDVASEIKATGVTCAEADPVVRAVKTKSGLNYSSNGFACTGVDHDEAMGLPYMEWTCISGAKKIVFSKT